MLIRIVFVIQPILEQDAVYRNAFAIQAIGKSIKTDLRFRSGKFP